MARGEGPGWHHESRRHSEVQTNKRPTHAKATKTPKELSEAYRKMNLAYKRADRAYAEGRDEEGQAFEDEAQKWSKEHTRLLNRYYYAPPAYSDGSTVKTEAGKALTVLQERAVKENKRSKTYPEMYDIRVRVNQEFQDFLDSTKGMSNAEIRKAVTKRAREAEKAADKNWTDSYYLATANRWKDAAQSMEMPWVVQGA